MHRCQALTAAGRWRRPQEAFERPHWRPTREGGDPFETARTRLLYGGRLRRAGQRVAAREHLSAARDAFVAMDLTHWVGGR